MGPGRQVHPILYNLRHAKLSDERERETVRRRRTQVRGHDRARVGSEWVIPRVEEMRRGNVRGDTGHGGRDARFWRRMRIYDR